MTNVKAPGSRGGHYWIDHRGTVRYDTPPHGKALHPAPPTGHELHTRTPGSIDTELAQHHEEYMRAAMRAENAKVTIDRLNKLEEKGGHTGSLQPWDARQRESAKIEFAKWVDVQDKAAAKMAPLDAEFYRRGRWSRFFLVINGNGHVHSTMYCQTCFPTTRFSWLPDLSGRTERDAVAEYGEKMCTVCFPSAPSLTSEIGEGRVARVEREARDARKAERAAKMAERLARGLEDPRRPGTVWFNTERSAYERLAEELHNIGYWSSKEKGDQRASGYAALAQRQVDLLATTLASKHGTSLDEEVAIARDKKRWPKIQRKLAKAGYVVTNRGTVTAR